MKKKIIIGLSIFALFFLVGGTYIIVTIETVTSRLDRLITLHQVEILREHLLIQIKRVQADLNLRNTRYARSMDTVVLHFRNMEKVTNTCFDCHHSEEVLRELNDLRNQVYQYRDALSRVLTIRANVSRLEVEEDSAYRIGEQLEAKVDNMISAANLKLDKETESALQDIADTKIILYILVALGPISTAGLAIIFIKGFTNPINALLGATKRLKDGNLDYKIEGLKDEFGEVAESFNEMAASLKEQIHKMQRTEQMVVLGELAAGLAHEIKNPLAGIKVSMEVLSEGSTIKEEDRAPVLKAIDEIKRIELLIKNLLNFAKPPQPQLTAVDINDLLDKTVTFSLRHPSLSFNTARGVNVSKEFDKSLPEIMADPMQLQQIFLNLLLNAVDAMPHGGTVAIKTFYDATVNSIRIEISDTGKGIDRRVIGKIFQPFFTTKPKGTGLGLAITKRLIEQHGGDICVESELGRGTIFNIFLPVGKEKREQTTT
jgi:signal transduction histidine kinase